MRSKTDISEIDAMIASFDAVMAARPDYPIRLIGLAEVVAKQPLRAFELCRKALAGGMRNSEVARLAEATLFQTVIFTKIGPRFAAAPS
jgi:hypothetical protein